MNERDRKGPIVFVFVFVFEFVWVESSKDVVMAFSRPPSAHPNPSGDGDYSSIVGFMKQLAVANLHAQIAPGGRAMLIPTLNSAAAPNPRPPD